MELKELKELSLAMLAEELKTIDWGAARSIVLNYFYSLNSFNSPRKTILYNI